MKYRYAIVEDEAIVRRGIELKMQLAHLPFELVGAASNGREGLELIRRTRPDLAIVDIRMPEMDGTELLDALRREALDTEVIVVSGYSNFEYARAGIRADICEYLLKPFSEEELRDAVQLVMARLRKKGLVVPEPASNRQEEEIRLLGDDLMGARNLTRPIAFSALNIDPERGRYIVCEVVRSDAYTSPKKPEGLDELVCIEAPGLAGREFVICYSRTGIPDAVLDQVIAQLRSAESVGVSLPCDRLQAARRQAQDARRDHPIRAHGTVLTYREPSEPEPMDDLLRDRLIFALESGDESWFRSQFLRYYNRCADLGWSVNRFLRSLRLFFEYAINHFSTADADELPTLFQFDYLTARCADDAQLPEVILRFIVHSFHVELSGSTAQSLSLIRQYLDTHFEEDLSLERIGQLFNVSPGYISRMFSQCFGTSYSNYISTLRINHSCALLRESMLDVSAIAPRCGFSSPKYFYRVFKRHIGCTPSEYRQRLLHAKDNQNSSKKEKKGKSEK